MYKTVHKYGNTSASSVPIALDELMTQHEIRNGEHLLLVAFGAGLTWGASVLTKIEE
jgi:3-oxoacyl-[acyl-carrier-protein] synthase-3